MEKIKQLFCKYREPILYIVFGALTTAVSFVTAGIAKAALEAVGSSADTVATVSTVFSWLCAVTFAYLTNRKWVFDSKATGGKAILREAISFFGGRVFSLLVEAAIMEIFNARLSFNYWIVKIAANVIVLILNYVISKWIVFRKK